MKTDLSSRHVLHNPANGKIGNTKDASFPNVSSGKCGPTNSSEHMCVDLEKVWGPSSARVKSYFHKERIILELILDLTTAQGKFNQHRVQIIMLRTSLTFAKDQVGFKSRRKMASGVSSDRAESYKISNSFSLHVLEKWYQASKTWCRAGEKSCWPV